MVIITISYIYFTQQQLCSYLILSDILWRWLGSWKAGRQTHSRAFVSVQRLPMATDTIKLISVSLQWQIWRHFLCIVTKVGSQDWKYLLEHHWKARSQNSFAFEKYEVYFLLVYTSELLRLWDVTASLGAANVSILTSKETVHYWDGHSYPSIINKQNVISPPIWKVSIALK